MPERDLARATEVASALVGGMVEVRQLTTVGRNSRIWRVLSGCRAFALKEYPSRQDDPRDRLSTEVGALQLMERYGIEPVPRVIGFDGERGYALLSWLDGTEVLTVADADIDAAVEFLAAIHRLRTTPWAARQSYAAEACLSGSELERQIRERLERLRSEAAAEKALLDFLNDNFEGAMEHASQRARARLLAAGLNFNAELALERRTLVPSDFGFHNSLRRSDGSLAFVDFEYFGWDDPAKLTADVLLHPGWPLQPQQGTRFRWAAVQLYGKEDAQFPCRLSAYLPLFGLRWVLILLNEFIPERWRRRVLAGNAGIWSDAKARQLERARQFLSSLPDKTAE